MNAVFGYFALHLNNGRNFINEPFMFYNGGTAKDKMSYFELNMMVEDLGYINMAKKYYISPRNIMKTRLRLTNNNKDIRGLLKCVKMTEGIEVYVEHVVKERVKREGYEKGWG